MIRFLRLLLVLQFAVGTCLATTWYVDRSATGLNSGSSWANAWESLTNINWSSVQPGDVVQIAKGTYPEGLNCMYVNGTSNAPITIELALSDPNRLGLVTIAGIGIGSANWVTIDGALDTNYSVPAAVSQLFTITNNIGLRVHTTGPGIYSGSSNQGIRLLWLNVDNCGTTNSQNIDGIHFQMNQNQTEVAYCWVHDNIYGDSLNYNTGTNPYWGDLSIHDCIFQNTGDDMFQVAQGTDIYRNIIEYRTYGFAHGHTDCFQTWGNYYRIHHNIIRDFAAYAGSNPYNSISYAQFSTPMCGNFLFYDNLVYDDSTNWLTSPGLMFSFDAWWGANKLITNQIITNIVIANNLFSLPHAQATGWTLYGAATDSSRGTNWVHTIKNCLFANNIILNCYNWANDMSGSVLGLPGPVANPVPINPGDPASLVVTTKAFPLLNNILVGPNSQMNYMGVQGTLDQVAATTGMINNWTNQPEFVAYTPVTVDNPFATDDFHLQASDTVARGKGYGLSAYTNALPMLDVGLDGNPRPSGAWDIGPYQYGQSYSTDPNLLLWISFADPNWTKGYMKDYSMYGRNAYEYGYGGQTNAGIYWPTKYMFTNNIAASQCGKFTSWHDSNIPVTGRVGQYMAVTNINAFKNMPQATISCWAYYDQSQDTNGNPISWTANNTSYFMSAGYGTPGDWQFGRGGNRAPEVQVWTNASPTGYKFITFADTFNQYGQSDGWHFYTWTFSNGVVRLYQDGASYSTTDLSGAIRNLTIAGNWLGIGCNTHSASISSTPQLGDDSYPNNGWMHGKLADIRIYNRALSAAEINRIYVGDGGALSVAAPPPPPTGLRILAGP